MPTAARGAPRSTGRRHAGRAARPHARTDAVHRAAARRAGEWRARWSSTALAAIAAGELEKVVLAREVDDRCRRAVRRRRRARHPAPTQPGCTVYADDGFVGASPELLVRRRGDVVVSRARWPAPATIRRRLLASAEGRARAPHRRRRRSRAVLATRALASAADGPARVRFADRHPSRDDDQRPSRRRAGRHCTRPRRSRSTRRPRSAAGRRAPARTLIAHARRPRSRGRYAGAVRLGRRERRRRVRRRAALRGDRRRARRGSTPVPASSPDPNPTRSGPRPRPSCSRCCTRSSGPELARREPAAATARPQLAVALDARAAVDGNHEHPRLAGRQCVVEQSRGRRPAPRARRGRARPRPDRGRAACRTASRTRAASCCGRNEKMPPPSLSMTTKVTGARSPRRADR